MKLRFHNNNLIAVACITLLTLNACSTDDKANANENSDKITPAPITRLANCDITIIQAASPQATTIVSAESLQSPAPHCKIDGYITTNNPGPNQVNFRLQLPAQENWNKRYYFIGMGGSAGYVPTDSQVPAGNPIIKGFAVAGTDTGHTAHSLDWGFLSDPAKSVDHIHRGAHVTAVATQQITKTYYNDDNFYRYHSGCSGGGRMGMEVIQKYPEDFDGILIGWPSGPTPVPGSRGTGFHIMVREMTREPGSWLSPAKLQFAEEKVTAACDAADGAIDDMIWDHRLCKFDFNSLQCSDGDAPNCLTKPEITSINNLLRDTALPISNMASWSFLGRTSPPWSPEPTMENMPVSSAALVIQTTWARTYLNQPDRDIVKNPLTEIELDQMDREAERIGFRRFPENTDLSKFEAAKAKALFWVGVSDPCCSNIANENYIGDVIKTMDNDAERVAKFAQLYQIPGTAHCGGGTGPDDAPDKLLQTLIDWVENNTTPTGVVMHRGSDRAERLFVEKGSTVSGVRIPLSTGVSRDFLVCPFPQVSVFDTSKSDISGAVLEAKNWSCQDKI